jgi:hypothetical protein
VNSSSPRGLQGRTSEPLRFGHEAMAAFRRDPGGFLTEAINNYVLSAPTNWSLPFQHPYFSAPVAIAFGDGDSQDFRDVKRKYPWTLTPRECLEKPPSIAVQTVSGHPKSRVDMPGRAHVPIITEDGEIVWEHGEPPLPPWSEVGGSGVDNGPAGSSYGGEPLLGGPRSDSSPDQVTCIAIGLPIHIATLQAETSYPWGNSPEMKVHSLWGAHLGFSLDLSNYVVKLLQMFGHSTISPYHTSWGSEFMMDFQYEGVTSRQPVSPCPDREWARAAGLGTFGLSDMLITERGMAVILIVIMTSAPIPPSPKPTREYCLFYRDRSCTACVSRCPGQAICPELEPPGRLSAKCEAGAVAAAKYNQTYLKERMLRELGVYAEMRGNLTWEGSGVGRALLSFPACGRCYTDVPCATRIP